MLARLRDDVDTIEAVERQAIARKLAEADDDESSESNHQQKEQTVGVIYRTLTTIMNIMTIMNITTNRDLSGSTRLTR